MAADDRYPYARPAPRTGPGLLVLLLVLLGLVVGGLVWWLNPFGRHQPLHDADAQLRPVDPGTDPAGEELLTINLFKDCKDSVVNVDTLMVQRDRLNLNLMQRTAGTGSGFIWDGRGYVVTNFHVIREVAAQPNNRGLSLRVTLADRTAWTARIVDYAPDYDLAVLKIDTPGEKLKPIKIGTSSNLQVGQNVYAIGNPFGLNLSLTKGIISALDRQIESVTETPISGVIQTDAAINPGNSGGPLLDHDGRLIGVNTAIASPSGANSGVGFAIPVDTVNQVVTELIRGGREVQTQKPALNVILLGDQLARELGVKAGSGAVIQDVMPEGAAARAGLHGLSRRNGDWVVGDVIVAVAGQPVKTNAELIAQIARHKIGDTVRLTVARGGQRREVEVTLQGI
jgi:S1-C subfamily serine protease